MASMALFQAKRKMTAIEEACVPMHMAFDAGEVALGGIMDSGRRVYCYGSDIPETSY
jgi:hypothetical protein